MHCLETLIRLNNDRGGIPLVFTTLVLTKKALREDYPGGVAGFLARYPDARQDRDLVTIFAMSGGEVQEVIDHLIEVGLRVELGLAVGDGFAGPLVTCPEIELYASRPDRWHTPGWKAVARSAQTNPTGRGK